MSIAKNIAYILLWLLVNLILPVCMIVGIIQLCSIKKEVCKEPVEMELMLKHSNFLKEWDANSTTMLAACEYYGVKYPKIVTAQAILESGNFKSKVFKEYNNPFGLYNSREKDYFRFNHWTDAILAYQKYIEYRYKGGDYYLFLDSIGYAEDPNYIRKVKAIEKLIPP